MLFRPRLHELLTSLGTARSAHLDHDAAFLPNLSRGLHIVVGLRLPNSDGLVRSAPQQTTASHQRRPDTGGSHVHSHVVNFRHEEVNWLQTTRVKSHTVEESHITDTEHNGKGRGCFVVYMAKFQLAGCYTLAWNRVSARTALRGRDG